MDDLNKGNFNLGKSFNYKGGKGKQYQIRYNSYQQKGQQSGQGKGQWQQQNNSQNKGGKSDGKSIICRTWKLWQERSHKQSMLVERTCLSTGDRFQSTTSALGTKSAHRP
eukprot:2795464-Amphidinium_carterae.3